MQEAASAGTFPTPTTTDAENTISISRKQGFSGVECSYASLLLYYT